MRSSHDHSYSAPLAAVRASHDVLAFALPISPAALDCLAGIELQHGHYARAEHLAQLAADMRETGR